MSKLSYILTDVLRGDTEGYEDNSQVRRLENLLRSKTGITNLIPIGTGRVDHQSSGTGGSILDMDDEDVLDFIFGKENILLIDNDNH
jgi:hypothetical protein